MSMPLPPAEPPDLWRNLFVMRVRTHLPITEPEATTIAMQMYCPSLEVDPEEAADIYASELRRNAQLHPGTRRK
jgi:hypothetical protein